MVYKMINSRVKALAQKPNFLSLLVANCSLTPASGFLEWRGARQGALLHLSEEYRLLCIRWSVRRLDQARWWGLYTFTIITREADEFMAHLHNRMPGILERNLEDAWLDKEITSAREGVDILERSAGVILDAYPESRMVNRHSIDN